MAAPGLAIVIADKMGKRKRPMESDGEEAEEAAEAPSGDYDSVKESALADMTEILGLKGADADDFAAALADYVGACVKAKE